MIEAREKAIDTHKTLSSTLTTLSLYTDGSGLDGHIRVAVMVPQIRYTQ
jgi:hypothetical protein